MDLSKKKQATSLFLLLSSLFIAALVSCNLIFQKFFTWSAFGLYTFELSVGILPYPITFLITDIISEIYGKKKANQVVFSGLFASVFVLGIVLVASAVPNTSWSPVNNETFNHVFGFTALAVFSSMLAYLLAQFIDIKIFHFWKNLTKGKHLWLRNNFSTISSQFVDTAVILLLLCYFNIIKWELFPQLFINGYLFKVIVALLDTPFFYLSVYSIRKYFGLTENEEILN